LREVKDFTVAAIEPSTMDNIDSDPGGVAEFFVLLGPEHFAAYQAGLVEALEAGSDPGAFWAKWIDVVVERTPPGGRRAEEAPMKEESSDGSSA